MQTLDLEIVATTALCIQEHIYETPNSPFAKAINIYRDTNGSFSYRDLIWEYAMLFEQACIKCDELNPKCMENVFENIGCWDFQVVPMLCDLYAECIKNDNVYGVKHTPPLEHVIDTIHELGLKP